jgi:hypothetical protein
LRRPSHYDPEYWRKGAQKLRDLAAQIDDKELKEQTLHVAVNLTSKRTKPSNVLRNWVKVKNPSAPAAKREAEEDWGSSGVLQRCGDNGAPSLGTASCTFAALRVANCALTDRLSGVIFFASWSPNPPRPLDQQRAASADNNKIRFAAGAAFGCYWSPSAKLAQ